MSEQATTQEPIDTVSTAQAKKRKPLPTSAWKVIRKRYLAGEEIADVAKEYGISESAIYAKVSRHNWPRRSMAIARGMKVAALPEPISAKQTEAIVNEAARAEVPAIQARIAKQVGNWLSKVEQNANDLQEKVSDRIHGRLEVEEIKTLALTLSSLHNTMRSVFGLDAPGGPAASPWAAASLARQCPVIDVEPVPDKAAAPYNSHYIQSATTEAAQGQDEAHNPTGPAQ